MKALKKQTGGLSVPMSLVLLVVMIFFVAVATMLIPAGMVGGQPGLATALIGALVLTVILVPLIYILVFRGSNTVSIHRTEVMRSPQLSQDSITDPLTRTLNRRGITIGLLDLMALADRYGHRLAIAILDVDRLSQINQQYGDAAGDRTVSSVAAILAEALRMADRVGRYTDNEFLLILPETHLEAACKLGERVRTGTARAGIKLSDQTIKTTVSVGVTEFRPGEDLEHLISRAEEALHQAKADGRDCVVCTSAK
ncbi:MAG TPA: GGDEF domain-containing protein [Acidiferrobacteraceae bacterium]|nr:GGDEF domain-containing protein [Acidiferrobacteraceae bacterium]